MHGQAEHTKNVTFITHPAILNSTTASSRGKRIDAGA